MSKQKTTPEKRGAGNGAPAKGDGADRQAAYFLSLSLENVRCFGPKQTLDLSDGHGKPARWTIILGVNGTGKTTILQSLVGFELLPEPRPPAKIHGWFARFLTHFGGDQHGTWPRGEKPATWTVNIASSSTLSVTPEVEEQRVIRLHPEEAEHLGYMGPDLGLPTPWCCAYGAGRRVGTASLSESEPDDPTATLFSDRAELRNPEEWLLRLDYAAAKSSTTQNQQKAQLRRATELLLNVLPDVDDVRFISTTGTHPKPRVEFKTPYGWVPFRQLGYGYQTLITWVADLASRMVERYPDSADPLAEPAVVLVDEIDLHLHPVWQRKLMGFLTERFPNTQFIATAHSPLVAQAAADANLAVLRREGDHVVIDNDVDDIRNWRIDQILTSDLFGLPTARPPWVESLIQERNNLLDKSKLTAAEKRRLAELNAEIEELPFGETKQERDARDQIKKTLDLLTGERKPAS